MNQKELNLLFSNFQLVNSLFLNLEKKVHGVLPQITLFNLNLIAVAGLVTDSSMVVGDYDHENDSDERDH